MSVRTSSAPADLYEILGVSPTASQLEIRRAYREKARSLHPDVNADRDAADRFAAVARAYDTLSDPERRRAYDLARATPGGVSSTWSGPGLPDVARNGRAGRPADPPIASDPSLRGLDVWQTVPLTLREAAFGADKTIEVPRQDVCTQCRGSGASPHGTVRHCPRCHGTGRGVQPDEECPRCHGNGGIPTMPCPFCQGHGRVETVDSFPLHFPGAIEDGEVLRIKNEGNPGPQGGPRGDLRLRIAVEPDPTLRRRGSEVYARICLTPEQAARGGRIRVPTLHGASDLKLPKGTPDGSTYIMKGRGLRLKGRWRRGDQHVTVHIAAPTTQEAVSDG